MTSILLAAIAVGLAVNTFVLLRNHPLGALLLWTASLVLVPYWVGLGSSPFVPLCVPVLALAVVVVHRHAHVTFDRLDVLVAALLVWLAALVICGAVRATDAVTLAFQSCVPYWLGRLARSSTLLPRMSSIIARLGAGLGVAAVAELLLDFHPFRFWHANNTAYLIFSPIQYRGGLPRSELAFGQSIALGNVIALTVPFILAQRTTTARKLRNLTMAMLGIAATFSRTAILCAVLAFVLSILFLRKRYLGRQTISVATAGLLVATLGAILIGPVYSNAGADTSASNAARINLLSLLPSIRIFGSSNTLVVLPDGERRYYSINYAGGTVHDVTSAIILIGLNLGFITVAILVGISLWSAARLFSVRGSNPAAVAFVSQLPAIVVTPFIAQWPFLLFFVLGLSVRGHSRDIEERWSATQDSDEDDRPAFKAQMTVEAE